MFLRRCIRNWDALDGALLRREDHQPGQTDQDLGCVWVLDHRSLISDQLRFVLVEHLLYPGPERQRQAIEVHFVEFLMS